MTRKRPKVIVTRKLPDIIETRMMELFDCELNHEDKPMDKEQLIHAVNHCDVLVPTVSDKIDTQVIDKASPRLKLIASFGTGIDHIDLIAARRRAIVVTNTSDVLTEDTADMTMALIMAVSRRLSEGERLIRSQKWEGWRPTSMLGHRIWGKRLGIIGMGRIGRALAKRAVGFGLSIHYHNRNQLDFQQEQELGVTYWESLDQMLSHMDIVSINCPHTPATYHLINARRLKLMKSNAIIINTSRGDVIDELALIEALKHQIIAGAGLDVFENEPYVNQEFLTMDHVVLLPHMGSATIDGRIEMGERVLINIRNFADGHRPPDRIIETLF
ncbi:MAG: D-glycerate dehydrogenase [Pseudomonadota bacterium]